MEQMSDEMAHIVSFVLKGGSIYVKIEKGMFSWQKKRPILNVNKYPIIPSYILKCIFYLLPPFDQLTSLINSMTVELVKFLPPLPHDELWQGKNSHSKISNIPSQHRSYHSSH